MGDRIPKYLYHYTSIANLVLILSSGNIRFSRLDLVSDPAEGQADDLPIASRHVFVSCWTAEEKESIPMWSLYAPDMRGCRLCLPADFLATAPPVFEAGVPRQELINYLEVRIGKEEFPVTVKYVDGPIKVKYTEDKSILRPQIVDFNAGNRVIVPRLLGIAKRPEWKFEREWRYRIVAVLENLRDPVLKPGGRSEPHFRSIYTLPMLTEALYPKLRPEALKHLVITMGPLAERADWEIASLATERYAPAVTVEESAIALRRRTN